MEPKPHVHVAVSQKGIALPIFTAFLSSPPPLRKPFSGKGEVSPSSREYLPFQCIEVEIEYWLLRREVLPLAGPQRRDWPFFSF